MVFKYLYFLASNLKIFQNSVIKKQPFTHFCGRSLHWCLNLLKLLHVCYYMSSIREIWINENLAFSIVKRPFKSETRENNLLQCFKSQNKSRHQRQSICSWAMFAVFVQICKHLRFVNLPTNIDNNELILCII